MPRRFLLGLVVIIVVAACALFPDLGSLEGSDVDAQSDVLVFADVKPPTTCDAATLGCFPAAPTGWSGPLELYEGDAGFPTCPGVQFEQAKGYEGLDASAPTTCTACGCQVANAQCALTVVGYPASTTCGGTSCGPGTSVFACSPLQGVGCAGELSAKVTGINTIAQCSPKSATVDSPGSSWSTEVLGCMQPPNAIVQADCPSGQVCAPAPVAPFHPTMCVTHNGDVACPAGYPTKHSFNTGVNDTRACSPCHCSVPPVPCTNVTLDFGNDSQCKTNDAGVLDTCVPFTSNQAWAGWTATLPTVACAFDGGAPSGNITAGAIVTACCAQ